MVSEQNTQYTDPEIAQAAYRAGFRGAEIGNIVAITLAESGGQSHPNDNVTYDSHGNELYRARGPLQILSTHHDFTGNPYDINDAMHYAWTLYLRAGRNFTPWEAYTTTGPNSYKQFSGRGTAAEHSIGQHASSEGGLIPGELQNLPGDTANEAGNVAGAVASTIPGVSQLKDGINAVGDFFNNLRQPATLARFSAGSIGLVLVLVGVLIIAWPAMSGAGKAAAEAA